MPTYPNDNPDLTVEAFLRDRQIVARALSDLTFQRFAADRLFNRGTADQVASGAVTYSRSESIFPDRDVRELALRTQYPRAGWSEELRSAVTKKYGLETPIAYESIRRNQRDQLAIGLRKIANSLVRFIDTLAMNLIANDPDTLGANATGDWSTGATSIKRDLIIARAAIDNLQEGYVANTLVLNPAQEQDIMLDDELGDLYLAFIGQGATGAQLTPGVVVPNFLGFQQVVVTPGQAAGRVAVMDSTVAGTIVDEAPAPIEGYTAFTPQDRSGVTRSPVYTKSYDETHSDTWVVRGVRWPAMYLSEPKAIYEITNA